jgi:lysophospholipase L1-like esterase
MCQHSYAIGRRGLIGRRRVDRPRTIAALCLVSAGLGGSIVAIGCTSGHVEKPLIGPPSVVFIGDSITQLWAGGLEGTEFSEHPNWIDKGISGQNSSQVLARFQTDVIDLQPEIVHILVGTNDVYPGWALVPSSASAMDSPANVEAMVEMSQAKGIHVILATIPPWGCDASNCELAETADATLSRYGRINVWNAWIEEYALSNGIPVVDYHSALVARDEEHYVPDLTLDGVHPSAAGYLVMTPMVEKAIDAISNVDPIKDSRLTKATSRGENVGERIYPVATSISLARTLEVEGTLELY